MSSTPLDRRNFLGRLAALTAAGAATALPTRALSEEQQDSTKALDLKITDLKTFVVDTGGDENHVFVKIYTNKGIVGLGEGTLTGKCRTVEAAILEHQRYLVGKDPSDIEAHWQGMFRGPRYRGGPIPRISTLGAPLKGVLWESTAVPEIRLQARDLAERLLTVSPAPAPASA